MPADDAKGDDDDDDDNDKMMAMIIMMAMIRRGILAQEGNKDIATH